MSLRPLAALFSALALLSSASACSSDAPDRATSPDGPSPGAAGSSGGTGSLGTSALAFELCSLPSPITAADASHGISGLALSPDGSQLYVAVNSPSGPQKLYRYTLSAGPGCSLTLDITFAVEGVYSLFTNDPFEPRVDGGGNVYLRPGPTRILPSPDLSPKSPASDAIATTDAAGTLYAVDFDHDQLKTYVFSADGVETSSVDLPGLENDDLRAFEIVGDELHLASFKKDQTNSIGVQVLSRSTQQKLYSYGYGTKAFADDTFCAISAVVPCGAGVCVLDPNCHNIKRFGPAGAFVDTLSLEKALSFTTFPIPAGIATRGDAGYLAVKRDAGGMYENLVYRFAPE